MKINGIEISKQLEDVIRRGGGIERVGSLSDTVFLRIHNCTKKHLKELRAIIPTPYMLTIPPAPSMTAKVAFGIGNFGEVTVTPDGTVSIDYKNGKVWVITPWSEK
jgi:hypothetical protein